MSCDAPSTALSSTPDAVTSNTENVEGMATPGDEDSTSSGIDVSSHPLKMSIASSGSVFAKLPPGKYTPLVEFLFRIMDKDLAARA